MKRWVILFVSAGVFSCQGEQGPKPVDVDLENKQHKESYALGMNLSEQLKQQKFEVDPDVFIQGFKDGSSGEATLMSAEDAVKILIEKQESDRASQQAEQSKSAEDNKASGEAFLAENKSKEGVVTTESGLQYKILVAGKGEKPKKTDTITFHYKGSLIDGTVFDSSYDRGEPLTMPLAQLIPGWIEAVQLMPVGSKWELYIPHYLGYGARPAGQIGPNSTLIFELELIDLKK
jgi:FKBP-type peptidyl-prolyl cis-trans isomerase FklB